jgi:hypothetical protein
VVGVQRDCSTTVNGKVASGYKECTVFLLNLLELELWPQLAPTKLLPELGLIAPSVPISLRLESLKEMQFHLPRFHVQSFGEQAT